MFEVCFGVLNGIYPVQVSVVHVVVEVGTACFCDGVVLFQSQCSSSLKTCAKTMKNGCFTGLVHSLSYCNHIQ